MPAPDDVRYGDLVEAKEKLSGNIISGHAAAMLDVSTSLSYIWLRRTIIIEISVGRAELPKLHAYIESCDRYLRENFDLFGLEWGDRALGRDAVYVYMDPDNVKNSITDEASAMFKTAGLCPRCGSRGSWIAMAAVCRWHGKFLG